MADYEVREFSIPVADVEGACPLPAGWQPLQAERRADTLVVLLVREAVAAPPLEADDQTA